MTSKRIVPNQDLSMHVDNTHVEIDIYALEVLQFSGTIFHSVTSCLFGIGGSTRHHHTNGTEASAGQEKIHHISTDHHRIICINKMRQYLMGGG